MSGQPSGGLFLDGWDGDGDGDGEEEEVEVEVKEKEEKERKKRISARIGWNRLE